MRILILAWMALMSIGCMASDLSEIFGTRNQLVTAILKYDYREPDPKDEIAKEAIKESDYFCSLIFTEAISTLPRRHFIHIGEGSSADALRTELETPLGKVNIFQTADLFFVVVARPLEAGNIGGQQEFVQSSAAILLNQDLTVQGLRGARMNDARVTLYTPLKVWTDDRNVVFAGLKIASIPGQRPSKTVVLNDEESQLTWFKRLAGMLDYRRAQAEKVRKRAEERREKMGTAAYDEVQQQIEERREQREAERAQPNAP